MTKEQQKQHLINMMKQDEELGLYDESLRKQFPANVEGSKEFNEMCKEEQTKCYCGHTMTCDCGPEQEIKLEDVFNDDKKENIKKFIDEINNPSQPNQALKDAAEKYSEIYRCPATNGNEYCKHDIISAINFGAKCQQERSYSEEEVIQLLQKALTHQDDGETGSLVTAQGKIRTANFFSWFEKFKKK